MVEGEPALERSRVVLYHQTIHDAERYVSLKPLIENRSGVTHLVVAAIHLNGPKAQYPLHLNDLPPDHPRFCDLWIECGLLQRHGIKVMCMLGGAAKGTYALLDGSEMTFEPQYNYVRNLLVEHNFDGIDLDVEEFMSIQGITRLITRLKEDFGTAFIISLAPVATAMHKGRNLSGFNYLSLEVCAMLES